MDPKRHLTPFIIAVIFALSGRSTLASERLTTLAIDVRHPGISVSPLLYGAFLEEYNHGIDGGLYAELVRNRSFEDSRTSEGWSLIAGDDSKARITLDDSWPLNDNNRTALRLEIEQLGGDKVGVANHGFWGINVTKGETYELSLFVRRSPDFVGPLTSSLEGADGEHYAQCRIEGLTAAWDRFSCLLTPNADDSHAALVIAASSRGTVWLDMVSLFPRHTWRERTNGQRPDLAVILEAMRPSFLRFPGGCDVEGDSLENPWRWKPTLGDIAERSGHYDSWGYRSTDGLGFHEYLQMCEDLGAEPAFVINAGMTCQLRDKKGVCVPLKELGPWVQDAVDAIEYANGPITSKWGALRAKHGHPSPFNLKYIEIGNENFGPSYEERYARFYDAIKSRYPQMQIIANVSISSRPTDIVAEHFYRSAEWFMAQVHRYDGYDRNGPKVQVGEYSSMQNAGKGNLWAALGEAAFMTGIERNSDVVVMACFGALLSNASDPHSVWEPNAIYFDSRTTYGTPSYYVQKLFSLHRGDQTLPVKLTFTAKDLAAMPHASGGVGLGTSRSRAEFKDIQVTHGDKVLFAPDFSSRIVGWRVLGGKWGVQEGAYRQLADGDDLVSVAGDSSWKDYTYSLKARKLGGENGFLIMFRVRDDGHWYRWNVGGAGGRGYAVEKSPGGPGNASTLSEKVEGRIETDRWYDMRVEVEGIRIRCYLDGKLIHDFKDYGLLPLTMSASLVSKTREVIVKVVNTSGRPEDTEINLEDANEAVMEGTEIVLTGKLEDENSLDQPTRIAPVSKPLKIIGPIFRHTFPPHSFTVLRLK